jgi:hypothetical protein
MPTIRFKIGTAFPASNPIARFVTVLAMMSNDWLRIMQEMVTLDGDDPETRARHIMLFRQQAALHHEAADRLDDAPGRFTEIRTFMASLPREAQADLAIVLAGNDPVSEHYLGDWHAQHRHVTFHYPILHPDRAAAGAEELHNALTAAAHLDGTITWTEDAFGSVRFGFADEVVVQWLPDGETQAELIVKLRDSALALARYVQRAVGAYLASLPSGSFTIEKD